MSGRLLPSRLSFLPSRSASLLLELLVTGLAALLLDLGDDAMRLDAAVAYLLSFF